MTASELLISLAIIVAVLIAAWRGGQANPVGTGRLAKRMDALELKVAEHGQRLEAIGEAMLTLADRTHSIDKNVEVIRLEIAADRGVTERTWAAVDRLQNYFIEEAFKRRGER